MFSKKKINSIDLFIVILPIIAILLVIIKISSGYSSDDNIVGIEVSQYTIKYGDTLSEIAENIAIDDDVPYKKVITQIKMLNPDAEFGIRAGDKLLLPKFIKKEVNK